MACSPSGAGRLARLSAFVLAVAEVAWVLTFLAPIAGASPIQVGWACGLDVDAGVVEGHQYDAYGSPYVIAPGPNGLVDGGHDDALLPASAYGHGVGFTGQRHDAETGLSYHRARYYDPQDGRFLGIDALGTRGDPVNAGDGCAYAGNNPLTWTPISHGHALPSSTSAQQDIPKGPLGVHAAVDREARAGHEAG